MQRSIVGILALVALVQGIDSLPVTSNIDALSQKLEDHYHGKNLDNEITFAECQSTFEEFAGLTTDDYTMTDQPNPLLKVRIFLDDFMYTHLNIFPEKLAKLQEDAEAAKEFVRGLEAAYKRFRPILNFENSMYDQITPSVETIKIMIDHLAGKSEQTPTGDQMRQAMKELRNITDPIRSIVNEQDVYENIDEYERLSKFWATPEVYTWNRKIFPLFNDWTKQLLYWEGDESVTKELQQVFQDEVAKLKKNYRSE